MMLTRRTFITTLAMAAPSLALRAQSGSEVRGMWAGAITATGATVKALCSQPGMPLRLIVKTADGTSAATVFEQTVTSGPGGVATFVIEALRERTRYHYSAAGSSGRGLEGSFRTFAGGPFSFRLGFASCANTRSKSGVFEAIRALQPDLFIHLGDLHYEDITRNDVALFGRAYTEVLTSPAQGGLWRHVPIAYTWDDHDFGKNNADSLSPSRGAALEAYRRFVPHYPLGDAPDAPISQAFSVGRVRVLMTDARSARSPHSGPAAQRTMLGAAQVEWLERQFEAAAAAPLIVWANSVPWITKNQESSGDGWAPYAFERQRLANTIARLGITRRLVMVSGDAHSLALDDGSQSQYASGDAGRTKGFAVVHAAPLDRSRSTAKGGPYSHGIVKGNGQFCIMDVDDDGTRVLVKIQGKRLSKDVPSMRLDLTM